MASDTYKPTVLSEIYTSQVVGEIAKRAQSDKGMAVLHRLLTAGDEHRTIERVHLDRCLRFAKERNGLDADRLQRLTEPHNYAAWEAVHNELLVPYFFSKAFNLNIQFVVSPGEKGLGDFQIDYSAGKIYVEVKTPKGDDPDRQGSCEAAHAGYDEHLIKPSFLEGARQLKRENKNLIVICTQLCAWIHDESPFEKLLYGQEVITAQLDTRIGRVIGLPMVEFHPNGELHRHRPRRYTRISAIASFRNDHYWRLPFSEQEQQVQFTVFHNYFAICQIDPDIFSMAEQFVPDKEKETIKHIRPNRRTLIVYMTDSSFTRFLILTRNFLNGGLRVVRRFYYRFRFRRAIRESISKKKEASR
jgi:hypothetical protein